ncbi:actin cytoskeleton-regulatory complex protein pan1-like [Lotus japonicus]|uniref:actin cytoskeleton-regulatory complex protein pan1-like n=1 Tax=Lotus japonicus TaxID=34305 RepID=UPI00258B6B60|nr:actin cytoskeleton-regulatory complex protein pan1-like [Lotus japonicus]
MSETSKALANYGLKVASLAISLAKVYKSQDAGRERLESDVARLKASVEKAKSEAAASKKAQIDVEERNLLLEKRASDLQREDESTRAGLEETPKKKEEEVSDLRSRHQMEIEGAQNELAKLKADNELLTGQAIEKYEEGFKYAKCQLRFLAPESNLKALGAYKRFVDGEWVGSDDSDSDESESETYDEEPAASDPIDNPPTNNSAEMTEEGAVEEPASPIAEPRVGVDSTPHDEQSPVVQDANGDEPAD